MAFGCHSNINLIIHDDKGSIRHQISVINFVKVSCWCDLPSSKEKYILNGKKACEITIQKKKY